MVTAGVLERELSTFQKNRSQFVETSLGKYVVIFHDEVLGVCDTYDEALGLGYGQVGVDDPFLVKQVADSDQVCHVYRGSITE